MEGMGRFRLLGMVAAVLVSAADAQRPSPKVDFFDYSGVDATVGCTGQPSKTLQTGEVFSIPYTNNNQACTVTLGTGEYVSFVVNQVLPGSSSTGLSVSVDIDDAYLFFTLAGTGDFQFVAYASASH